MSAIKNVADELWYRGRGTAVLDALISGLINILPTARNIHWINRPNGSVAALGNDAGSIESHIASDAIVRTR